MRKKNRGRERLKRGKKGLICAILAPQKCLALSVCWKEEDKKASIILFNR